MLAEVSSFLLLQVAVIAKHFAGVCDFHVCIWFHLRRLTIRRPRPYPQTLSVALAGEVLLEAAGRASRSDERLVILKAMENTAPAAASAAGEFS